MNRNTNVENMHFTANDAKPVLCAVHLGTMIVAENTLFKVCSGKCPKNEKTNNN